MRFQLFLIFSVGFCMENPSSYDLSRINIGSYLLTLPKETLLRVINEEKAFRRLELKMLINLLAIPNLNVHFSKSQISKIKGRIYALKKAKVLSTPRTTTTTETTTLPEYDYYEEYEDYPEGPVFLNLYLEDLAGPELADVLNKYNEEQIKVYMNSLNADTLVALASKPGMLTNLNTDKVIFFSNRVDVLSKIDVKALIPLANQRPEIVTQVPVQVLDTLARLPGFMTGLSNSTIRKLVNDPVMANHINLLSKSTLRAMVLCRPEILIEISKIRGFSQLKNRIFHLLLDRKFLKSIPVWVHLYLARTEIRKRLNPRAVLTILAAHPELPQLLDQDCITYFSNRFLKEDDTWFLEQISCSVILNSANDIAFVDKLSPRVLGILIQNDHVMDCLPTDVIRKIMKDSHIGRKVEFSDVLVALQKVLRSKKFESAKDATVAWNAVRYQVPQMKRNLFSIFRFSRHNDEN